MKNYKQNIGLTIILTILNLLIYAQDQKKTGGEHSRVIDSLFSILKTSKEDSTAIKTYLNISQQYQSSNLDTAIYFANTGLKLAQKVNYIKGISQAYLNIGIVLHRQGNYNKAIDFFFKSLKIKEESGDKNGMSDCYYNIGSVHYHQGNYDKALEFYLKTLKIKEKLKNKKGVSACYTNLGNVHIEQGNYNTALEYYNKSLKIKEELGDKAGISICNQNIGLAYDELGNYDKALKYYSKSLKIDEELGDKIGLSVCYINIGITLYKQGNYKKSIESCLKSLIIKEELGDKYGKTIVWRTIANIHITIADSVPTNQAEKIKYYKEAVSYGLKSYKLAKEIKAMHQEHDAAYSLMEAYRKLGNFKESVDYAEIYIATKDSMFKEEKTKALADMEAKYQNEKKQLEIDKLGKEKELQISENKKQKIIIWFVVSGLLLLIVIVFLIFRSLRITTRQKNIIENQKQMVIEKNNMLNQQNEEIITQRDEIEAQRDLVTNQKEKIESIHESLTDSIRYAERIQKAVLPSDQYIKNQLQGFGYFVLYKPTNIVSGDFYFFEKRKENLFISVADCTGHGVPGAFMSMLGISFLQEIIAKEEIKFAGHVLNELRNYVIRSLQQKGISGEQKDGMDIAFCIINTKTLEMNFSGANNPLYVISKSETTKQSLTQIASPATRNDDYLLHEIKGDKMPIGIYENMNPFTNHIYQLHYGDIIYMMSDGFEDQFGGPKNKKFLIKNLKNLLKTYSQKPMADQKQTLETIITEWIGSNDQIDDITVCGVKI